MGQSTTRYSSDGIEKFRQQVPGYGMDELRIIYEYFRRDLIYAVEPIDTKILLKELASRNILFEEEYAKVNKGLGHFVFSEKLVKDILDAGREAVIAFWESLYDLEFECRSPNLNALLQEINMSGDALMQQIILDKYGHPLSPELKDMQGLHKQHLLDKAQDLLENRSPGSMQENQSSYISEHGMDLIVGYLRPLHKQSRHWLIETGEKHEDYLKNELECISPNRLFRWSQRLKCVPHTVLVSGVPGIGKTTLMQKFVYDWSTGKLYQRFDFVFFFTFQELNRLDEVSLETMILRKYPYLQGQLENILQDPEKLLFIFDGLDENSHRLDFRISKLCHNIKQIENLGVIVVSLLRQSLLKGCCSVLTTSRTKLASVESTVFKRQTQIMGFLPRDIQMYCEHFYRNKELSDKIFNYIRDNGTLYNFCYLPSYCWIICTVLSKCFKDQPANNDQMMSSLPKTLTQLFATFIVNILSNHSQDKEGVRELLTSIGWMAEHGVMNRIVAFNEQDLASFNVDTSSQLFSSLMIKSDQSPNMTFSFLHVTLQEFFAALVHYINECPEKLHKSLEETKSYKDNHGEIFLSFLCGLSDNYSRSILKPYLGELSSQTAKDVITFLQQTIIDVQECKKDKRKVLNVLFDLFETQNKDLVSESLGSYRSFNFSFVDLTPLDYTVLSFILESCKNTEELWLGVCKIHSENMERLAPALYTVNKLGICSNNLRDDGVRFLCDALKHPECKIQNLSLALSKLTDISCCHLGSVISNNRSLRRLELSYNKLEGPHFSDLMTGLSSPTCRIEELYLDSTGLKDSSCSHLASAITNNQYLRILNLSFNDLTGPHFGDLMTALSSPSCSVEQLMFQDILLSDDHVPFLVSLSNSTKLTHLELSHNQITDTGVSYIEELILKSTSLKDISLLLNCRLSCEARDKIRKLKNHKPGLCISIE
ncbi:LOW QUALITY PROTEIN: NACHT, LRR and PYD domains-containing protein 12-like [Mixophyes fleayi]|uniref:LOW QUALITY PROTEIN: NACHT, LRR and PYD domains-containing protein 12-like n=1 Tax=Mixophyes fleayi TaxID=3061075 RepID=UPI003F4E05B5